MPAIIENGRGRSIALVALLALAQAASAGLAAFATRDLFSALHSAVEQIPVISIALIALSGASLAVFRIGERISAERLGQDYAAALRVRIFKHMSAMPASELAKRRNGSMALRFVGDLSAVRGWASLGLARLVSASITVPLAFAVLFALNPSLALWAAAPFIVGLGVMAALGAALGSAHRKLRRLRSRVAADMSERIPHAPELRLLGRMKTELKHLSKRTAPMIAAATERARGVAVLRAVPDLISGLAGAAVFYAGFRIGAPAADIAASLAVLAIMLQPVRDLADCWDRRRAWLAAREKCLKLFDTPTLILRPSNGQFVHSAGAKPETAEHRTARLLQFKSVCSAPLNDLDLIVSKDDRIAVFGPNGSGKSALLRLAAGLERPDKGVVLLKDQRHATFSPRALSNAVSLSRGASPILAGSLRRGLTMGSGRRPADEDVMRIAARYGLAEVVKRVGGLEGRIAEGGRNLSVGEKRRLLLARAALSGAELLLVDDPTQGLDSEGQELVQKLIEDAQGAVLIATSDMAIARLVSKVWTLRNGRLAEGPAALSPTLAASRLS